MEKNNISKEKLFQLIDDAIQALNNGRNGGFGSTGKKIDANTIMENINKANARLVIEKLDEHIEKANKKNSEIYNPVMSRQAFSNFINTGKISKKNLIAFCVVLNLNSDETKELLQCKGFNFGNDKFDVIIKTCIENSWYDRRSINEILYDYGEEILFKSY